MRKSYNKLLSALPNSVFQRLSFHLEEVSLSQGQTIHKSGELITDVYFPRQASVSLVLILSDKSTTEVGLVGNEGMAGLPVILGGKQTNSDSIVQIAGTAMKLPSQILQEEFQRGEELQKLLLLYTQAQLSQIAQIAACQSHHVIEQRLARWLLLVRDCTNKNTLPLTQKLISMMLGVRRASVTEAAISLQQAGIITYSRGQIVIVNSQLLETFACECYGKIKEEYSRLLNPRL
ncbi:cAMP-binding protein [Hyella patelloides LEGE 07179]|uniref:cAMP-binding protein n=1 Tax=Hyella patelloides LEGE 07179 TaxID=945734 RepID=A0A563VTJ3_9CYAN|nr:Crp/Fnr family transcriptional regulator [Hyella patelloides]VEP14767.1 cAMP-binding protein [Hyella patelloides LEGE 07179]